jgi:hypothetical protein
MSKLKAGMPVHGDFFGFFGFVTEFTKYKSYTVIRVDAINGMKTRIIQDGKNDKFIRPMEISEYIEHCMDGWRKTTDYSFEKNFEVGGFIEIDLFSSKWRARQTNMPVMESSGLLIDEALNHCEKLNLLR